MHDVRHGLLGAFFDEVLGGEVVRAQGQTDEKRRAEAGLALDVDAPAVPFD